MKVKIQIEEKERVINFEEEYPNKYFINIFELGLIFRKAALAAGYSPESVNQIIDEDVVNAI